MYVCKFVYICIQIYSEIRIFAAEYAIITSCVSVVLRTLIKETYIYNCMLGTILNNACLNKILTCACKHIYTLFNDLLIVAAISEWKEQTGQAHSPKTFDYSSRAKIGDIFRLHDVSYMALFDGPVDKDSVLIEDEWMQLKEGTFFLPKSFNDMITAKPGDIFYDPKSKLYYSYVGQNNLQLQNISTISTQDFVTLDYKQEWMTMLRPVIGDKRLGDIVLPGTHDSGSWGINEDSVLVDMNFLYQLGQYLTPETIANWSLTQSTSFASHLNSGFRNLDLRIADLNELNDTFRWWHGFSAEPIFDGLAEIADFAATHQEEILFLYFQHFAAPGNVVAPTLPIAVPRKQELAEIILDYLGNNLVHKDNLTDNPTINEILSTGRNIIAQMEDDYIRNNYDGFWPVVVQSSWTSQTNPEELFIERSSKLETFLANHPDQITDISGCNTAGIKSVVASLLTVYGDNENITDIVDNVLPAILEVEPEKMSFEGLYTDLFTMALQGTNLLGMYARPPENYTNGASVHYRGVNDMLPYWVARPHKFKMNIIYVDAFQSSTIVDTAIQANLGQIPRQATIAFQGNTRDGYYAWNEQLETEGGDDGLQCNATLSRYRVTSASFALSSHNEWFPLPVRTVVNLSEGQYPTDAVVSLQVSTNGVEWYDIFDGNVQQMIDDAFDVYLRSVDNGNDSGFAYISQYYNAFSDSCFEEPTENFLTLIRWP